MPLFISCCHFERRQSGMETLALRKHSPQVNKSPAFECFGPIQMAVISRLHFVTLEMTSGNASLQSK